MTPEDYARVRTLFDRAMQFPPADRRAFVDRQAPTGDPVRTELLAMVEAEDDSTFLANAFANGVLDQVRPAGDGIPSQIGKYKILRPLGKGGMGVVFLALRNDDVFQKVVALKVIGDVDSPGINLVERFKRERQILAGLDHPNIARILDGGNTDEGRPFYVMEYVAGSPIDEYCTRMNTAVSTRVRMMAQVCDAVEYLHKNAIAHRDIKPQNILVTLEGQVKLVDFGIAKVETVDGVLRSSSSSAEPTMIMTPSYASPEQIAGDASGRSGDVYSVAVVLYQLLTGRLPHAGSDGRPDLAARLAGTPPEPPSKEITKATPPAIPAPDMGKVSFPDLDHVVLTALQRDPSRRYGTLQLFAEDLRRCLDGRPITARPHTVGYTTRKAISRNPVVWGISAAAVVIAMAGGWLGMTAYMQRAELQGREQQLAQFVSALATRVATWPGGTTPETEKVADMRAARDLMASEGVRTLSARAPDPPRVKQLINELRTVIDRADAASLEAPNLRKEIALVYRRIGDVESRAPLPAIADKRQAAETYRKAAVIAADLRQADGTWASQQLTELSGLLVNLGAPLDTALTQSTKAAEPTPEPPLRQPPASPGRRAAATATTEVASTLPEVDAAAKADVEQRLRSTSLEAERARRNFEMLRNSLAASGQTIRGNVEVLLIEAEGLIEDARGLLDQNDLANADDHLRRASYQLKRVLQTVGG